MVVEAVMIFGSGVAGLSVLTHTHTPPTVDFTMEEKPSRTSSLTQAISSRTHDFAVHPHAQALGGFGLTQTFSGAP